METTTATELLFISFEVPPEASTRFFAAALAELAVLYQYCAIRMQGFIEPPMRSRYPDENFQSFAGLEPAPRVRQMHYGSPWEMVLSAAVTGTPWATGAAAGYGVLRGLRELLNLKKDWDLHRAAMRRENFETRMRESEAALQALRDFDDLYPLRDSEALASEERRRSTGYHAHQYDLASLPTVLSAELRLEGELNEPGNGH